MIGMNRNRRGHYICGSQPYRKGLGCGPGVYIRVEQLEAEVIKGVSGLLRELLDPKKLTTLVNAELKRLWKSEHGAGGEAEERLKATEDSIANFRRAVERGIDVDHALDEIDRLQKEGAKLEATRQTPMSAPKVDAAGIRIRLTQIEQPLATWSARDRKELIGMFLQEMTLAPETLEISTIYRVPEAIMNEVVAGVGF